MAEPFVPELVFYTRDGCHLCDDARTIVQSVLEDRAAHGRRNPVVRERDIATDAAWESRFSTTIPVLEIAGRRLELATSALKIRQFLNAALDGTIA